jgi:hypothetical protein
MVPEISIDFKNMAHVNKEWTSLCPYFMVEAT